VEVIMKTFYFATSLLFGACIPVHDYTGDYDMTYDLLMQPQGSAKLDARAGVAQVSVHKGLNEEYLVNLGTSFCRLEGTYVEAKVETDWPYLDVSPQDCWFTADGKTTIPMMLTGSATFDRNSDPKDARLSIVLSGTYEPDGASRGSATVQFTETW
jgi:hypothetical protein